MTTELRKMVTRLVETFYVKGRPLVVKMTMEGIYLKRQKERWSSAYFVPWQAMYVYGARIRALQIMDARKAKKKARRLT